MDIVATGGCGFIGSHVVDRLIDLGHNVTVIDNLSTGDIANLNSKASFIEADITGNIFDRIPRADYVFHLAALARVQPSIENPVKSHNANINGTMNVLEYCRKHGSKLIYSSSSSIFSGEQLPTNENDRKLPQSPYALQKWVGEQYINLYTELYDLDAVMLRYFSVYGERQILGGGYATAIGIFLNQRELGKPLTIYGDGSKRRDFTYVGDVADANILAMNWNGVFNIGHGENYSIKEIAELISDDIVYEDDRPGEVQDTLCDNSRARHHGWEPKMEVAEWLSRRS